MKIEENLCDGNYCSRKEKCQLYIDFLKLVNDKKFPKSIDSLWCVEPIWQKDRFIKAEFSRFKKIKKDKHVT